MGSEIVFEEEALEVVEGFEEGLLPSSRADELDGCIADGLDLSLPLAASVVIAADDRVDPLRSNSSERSWSFATDALEEPPVEPKWAPCICWSA